MKLSDPVGAVHKVEPVADPHQNRRGRECEDARKQKEV